MSVRYGISLIPEPRFAARAYRARQLICGQYACWAAEMHMLQLPLVEYFQCPDDAVDSVSAGLGRIAAEGQRKYQGVPLAHPSVTVNSVGTRDYFPISTAADHPGDIFLDFTVPGDVRPRNRLAVNSLRADVLVMLGEVYGVSTDCLPSAEEYKPRIYLMQHADLPESVFDSAVDFAAAVAQDLELPKQTRAWQAVLLRFESAAAEDNWNQGGWAPDLSWKLLASHPI